MKEKEKNERCEVMTWIVIGSVLTVAGILVIPPLVKKYGTKLYKKSLQTDEIDFDEMGPEIVQFEQEEK